MMNQQLTGASVGLRLGDKVYQFNVAMRYKSQTQKAHAIEPMYYLTGAKVGESVCANAIIGGWHFLHQIM